MKRCLVKCFRIAEQFQRCWNKISQKIFKRLARHHIQRFSASDAAASTQRNFCTSWIGIVLAPAKRCFICIQIFGSLSSGGRYKGSKCRAESSISSRISGYIILKLTLSIVFVRQIMFTFSNSQFIPNCPNPGHFKNQLFLLLQTAGISLALPLSPLPLTRDKHVVCLQWNVSQYV